MSTVTNKVTFFTDILFFESCKKEGKGIYNHRGDCEYSNITSLFAAFIHSSGKKAG
jgi:hypothetical protein